MTSGTHSFPSPFRIPDAAATRTDWLSAHLRFGGAVRGLDADQIIVNVVAPFIDSCRSKGWSRTYFFVRYSSQGPHIRLRIKSAEAFGSQFISALHSYIDEYIAGVQETAAGGITIDLVPYKAELDRYGGAAAVGVAEELFCASADLAIAVLRASPTLSQSARLGKSMLGMAVLIHAFLQTREAAADFAQWYATQYLRRVAAADSDRQLLLESFDMAYTRQASRLIDHVGSVFAALQVGESLSPDFDAYRDSVCTARDAIAALAAEGLVLVRGTAIDSWESCVRHLLPSYLHMANNRLGVSIPEEAYVAYLIHRALVADSADLVQVF